MHNQDEDAWAPAARRPDRNLINGLSLERLDGLDQHGHANRSLGLRKRISHRANRIGREHPRGIPHVGGNVIHLGQWLPARVLEGIVQRGQIDVLSRRRLLRFPGSQRMVSNATRRARRRRPVGPKQ